MRWYAPEVLSSSARRCRPGHCHRQQVTGRGPAASVGEAGRDHHPHAPDQADLHLPRLDVGAARRGPAVRAGGRGIAIRIEEAGPAPAAFTPRTETRVPSSGGGPSSHVDRTPPGTSVTAAGVQPPRAILTSQRSAGGAGRNAGPRRHAIVTPPPRPRRQAEPQRLGGAVASERSEQVRPPLAEGRVVVHRVLPHECCPRDAGILTDNSAKQGPEPPR